MLKFFGGSDVTVIADVDEDYLAAREANRNARANARNRKSQARASARHDERRAQATGQRQAADN